MEIDNLEYLYGNHPLWPLLVAERQKSHELWVDLQHSKRRIDRMKADIAKLKAQRIGATPQ